MADELNIGFAETVTQDQFGKPLPVQTVPPDPSMLPRYIPISAAPGNVSGSFPKRTRWLRLQCNAGCEFWVGEGSADFPAGGGFPMEAGQTEMFGIDKDAYRDVDALQLRVRTRA